MNREHKESTDENDLGRINPLGPLRPILIQAIYAPKAMKVGAHAPPMDGTEEVKAQQMHATAIDESYSSKSMPRRSGHRAPRP